jgi:protein KRI1
LVGFEDLIGNDIKTKYSYITVDHNDFGLTDVELFFADDRLLNQMVSTKKLFAYRENSLTDKDRRRI